MHTGFQPSRRAALISVAATLAACGGGGSGDGEAPVVVGQVINSTVKSTSNGNTYPIQIYLPQ
ncbi:MAG: hypothetical protein EOO27_38150, partial [Comamonadaceae bacterium]